MADEYQRPITTTAQVDGEAKDPLAAEVEGEKLPGELAGCEKVEVQDTRKVEEEKQGPSNKLHCDSSDSDSKSSSDSDSSNSASSDSKSDSASDSSSDSDSKSDSASNSASKSGGKSTPKKKGRKTRKGLKKKLSIKLAAKEVKKNGPSVEMDVNKDGAKETKKDEEGAGEEKQSLLDKLQCDSSDSGSNSSSKSGSDSSSKSGSSTLKEHEGTKKIRRKGLKEKIKKELSGKKIREEEKKINVLGFKKDEAREGEEGVKDEKLSLLNKLQCDSSDSDSKSGSDSDSKSSSDSGSKSGSDSGSSNLKEEKIKKARKKGLLKDKLSRKKVREEKKRIFAMKLAVNNEDEGCHTKKIEESEEKKNSPHGMLYCDSSNSGFDSNSSSDKDDAKGQGEKKKGIKEKTKDKLSIHNMDEKDKKVFILKHEMELETTAIGIDTTIIAEKLEEPKKIEESLEEEKKSFLEKLKEKLPGHYKKPTEEVVAVESLEFEKKVQDSKEKKGTFDKIMMKFPGYNKNNEDESEIVPAN